MAESTLHDRLTLAAGSRSYRQLAELTSTHHETVRRYMQGQAPSVDFISALCGKLAINATWMLTGHGPMKQSEVREAALAEADPAELLTAVADTLSDLIDRVERLERYCQTLETRLRGARALENVNEPPQSAVPARRKATRLGEALG